MPASTFLMYNKQQKGKLSLLASTVSSIQARAHQIGLKCSSRVHLCDNATAGEHSSTEYPFPQKPVMVKVLFCSVPGISLT